MPKNVADLDPAAVTADTDLPDLGDFPEAPEAPAIGPAYPEALTAGQRAYLDGILGDRWTVAVDGKVSAGAEDVDVDGRPVARLSVVTDDGLDISVEVRPPLSAEDVEQAATAAQEAQERHAAEMEAYDAERRAWDHLAALHRSRAAARDAAAEVEASAARAKAEADRFNAAVDERVKAVIAELGIASTK